MTRYLAKAMSRAVFAGFSIGSTAILLFALGLCLVAGATAHGEFIDLARSATVTAVDYHAVYNSSEINNGIASGEPYYWPSAAGQVENDMTIDLGWTSARTFDTVMVHFFNHSLAYTDANGTSRVYHLQKETSPGIWEDIATSPAVSDPDDATPFAQFRVPGGVSLEKVRVKNLFDLHEVAVWDRTGNIASSATVTASFVDSRPEYAPSKVADNDFSTMYYPGVDNDLNMSNTGWMQFDWTGLQQVDSVRAYFYPHSSLIEGRVVSLQQEIAPDVWETIATTTVGREDSGYYQAADFTLPANSTFSKLRLENTFDAFEVDIIGSPVPEPSSLALLAMSVLGLAVCVWRKQI